MPLQLTDRNLAHQIAERIRTLIARQDDGDVTIAARRLARPIADVYSPERVIASGDELAAVEFLATVVHAYEADACWLITGKTTRNAMSLSREARGMIVEVLEELSDHLIDEVRNERQPDHQTKSVERGSTQL